MADRTTSRRLAVTASLLASGAMVAGTSALAWPTIRHLITPPAVTTDHPSLRAVQPGGSAVLSVPGGDAASGAGMAFLVPTSLSTGYTADSPAAPAIQPIAMLQLPAAEGEDPAGEQLALRHESDDSFFIDQNHSPDLRVTQPTRGDDGLGSSEESSQPDVLVQPRLAPRPVPRSDEGDLADQRNRLNGHWSVGKFR